MLVQRAIVKQVKQVEGKTVHETLHDVSRSLAPAVEEWQLARALEQQYTIKTWDVVDGVLKATVAEKVVEEVVEEVACG